MKGVGLVCVISLALIYFSAFVRMYDALNVIALYVALPIAFFLSFLVGNSLNKNKYLFIIVCMYLWVCFTYLFADYVDTANVQMKQILGVVLLCITVANLTMHEKLLPWLYGIFIVFFISISIYAQQHILNVAFDISRDRLNDEKLNANMMAYFLFYATVSIYFIGELVKNRVVVKASKLILFALIPISFYVAILTASRQVLIIQIPLLLLLLIIRYGRNVKRTVSFIAVIAVIVGIAYTYYGKDMYEHSYLKQRSESKVENDPRTYLMEEAIKIGFENPLVGVGPSNFQHYNKFHHFSHNTYLELFANTGVLGLILYLYAIAIFMKRQWKRYRQTRDRMYLTFFCVGLIFMVDNFFYVFYVNLWLMAFIILLTAHSEIYYKTKLLNYGNQ